MGFHHVGVHAAVLFGTEPADARFPDLKDQIRLGQEFLHLTLTLNIILAPVSYLVTVAGNENVRQLLGDVTLAPLLIGLVSSEQLHRGRRRGDHHEVQAPGLTAAPHLLDKFPHHINDAVVQEIFAILVVVLQIPVEEAGQGFIADGGPGEGSSTELRRPPACASPRPSHRLSGRGTAG